MANTVLRVALFILGMTAVAGLTFFLADRWIMQYGPKWAGYEQKAAIACLVVALMPLIAYVRSSSMEERIWTGIQTVILVTIAVEAGYVSTFTDRPLYDFIIWFSSAAIGVAVVVSLTIRLAQKNGKRLSSVQVRATLDQLRRMRLLETKLGQMWACYFGTHDLHAKQEQEDLGRLLADTRREIELIENQLHANHVDFLPVAFTPGDDISCSEAEEDERSHSRRAS